jgi:hypothetical protein
LPTPDFSLGQLLTAFFTAAFSLALPLGVLFLLYKIYIKLKNIEEQLKKN